MLIAPWWGWAPDWCDTCALLEEGEENVPGEASLGARYGFQCGKLESWAHMLNNKDKYEYWLVECLEHCSLWIQSSLLLNEAAVLGRGAWYWLEVLSSNDGVMVLLAKGEYQCILALPCSTALLLLGCGSGAMTKQRLLWNLHFSALVHGAFGVNCSLSSCTKLIYKGFL